MIASKFTICALYFSQCCGSIYIFYIFLSTFKSFHTKNCSDAVNPTHLILLAGPNLENTNNMQMQFDPGVINMPCCIHIH